MHVLEWKQAARADLLAIIDYISDDNLDAAQRLKDEIVAKTEQLKERPKLYRTGRIPHTREMVVHSNYVVIYQENEHTIRPSRPEAAILANSKNVVGTWPAGLT